MKTMEMNEAWPDIYDEGYIHQFQAEPTTKFRSTEFKDIFLWKISQMTTKTLSISMRVVITYVMI